MKSTLNKEHLQVASTLNKEHLQVASHEDTVTSLKVFILMVLLIQNSEAVLNQGQAKPNRKID